MKTVRYIIKDKDGSFWDGRKWTTRRDYAYEFTYARAVETMRDMHDDVTMEEA